MTDLSTTVFFSWQSDIGQDVTTQAIRNAVRASFSALEGKHGGTFRLDEATRNMPGAQNIPITLIEKIKNSDIFVADITSVTKDGVLEKSFPNPNVTFELGYAVAHLGWPRIVLLFNKSIAELKDLPFDFDRQRISPYKLAPGSKKASDLKPLNDLVHAALDLIVVEKPRRPRELEGKTEREIKRERDVRALRRILSLVSTTQIDQHTDRMPEHIHYSAAYIADILRAALQSNDFKLYDQQLLQHLNDIDDAIHLSLTAEAFYNSLDERGVQQLIHDHRPMIAAKRSAAMTNAHNGVLKLKKSLNDFTDHIRNNYLEIDLDEFDRVARDEYKRATEYMR